MYIRRFLLLAFFSLWLYGYASAQCITGGVFNLSSYKPHANGETDDTPAFRNLFRDVEKSGGGVVSIPPGDYYMNGVVSVQISSNTTVFAYGAKFFLPKVLGDRSQVVLFQGTDISDLYWFGGFFKGYCFDPDFPNNTWEPNVNTRIFEINTSVKGRTNGLTFRDISSNMIAGSVINVNGFSHESDSSDINYAMNISVENCTLINSGKFMWDYGFLWQIIVYHEEYPKAYLDMAYKYFDRDLIFDNIKIQDGESNIYFQNAGSDANSNLLIKESQDLCFFNDRLPENLVRGKRYYVIEASPTHIAISDSIDGSPIKFKGSGGSDIKIINQVRKAFFQYAPLGAGKGKGCIDLVECKNTTITGCRISALGDAMHVYKCHDNVFANNHILGARMGAFFLANNCKNSTIIGNTVNGTNGSRTVSIERSNENVTVIGNVFRNGGRGSWINQPKNVIIQSNIFEDNTKKGEQYPLKGRRDFKTGGWQSFPEIYFTTYQENGKYGPVKVKDNIFITGPEAAAAIQFEKNGFDIQVEGNEFKGSTGVIMMDENDHSITIENNRGAILKKGKEYSKSLFKNE